MSKFIDGGLLDHYQGGTTSLAHLLRITRMDDAVFGFTSASRSVTIDDVTYDCSQGLNVTNVVTSSGLAVDNLELTTFPDPAFFTRNDVLSGVWRNAQFLIARYNWRSPVDPPESILAGIIGNVRLQSDSVVAELLGWQQFLQQPVGSVTSKVCRVELGSTGSGKCNLDLTPFTFNATVTSVTDQQVFGATGLTQVDDYFGGGSLTWLTGDNAGIPPVLVKSFANAGGVVSLALPMFVRVQVGDTFRIVAGCRKRLQPDCRDKFDNVFHFQGEDHLPGIDALTRPPE